MIIFINIIISNQAQTEEAKWEKTSAEDKLATTLYNLKVVPKYQNIKVSKASKVPQYQYTNKHFITSRSSKSIKVSEASRYFVQANEKDLAKNVVGCSPLNFHLNCRSDHFE